jgi:hypothetical protein
MLRLSEKTISWDDRPGIFLREGNPPHQQRLQNFDPRNSLPNILSHMAMVVDDTGGVNKDLSSVLRWFFTCIPTEYLIPLPREHTDSLYVDVKPIRGYGSDRFYPPARIPLSTTKDITPLGHAIDANIILSWFIYLGGPVEEETFWADDKSYAVAPSLLLSAQLIELFQRLFGNDPLAPISEDCGRYRKPTG